MNIAAGSVWISWLRTTTNTIVATGASVNGFNNIGAFIPVLELPSSSGMDFGSTAIGPSGQVVVNYQDNNGNGPANIYLNTKANGLGSGGFGPRVTVTSTNVGGFAPIPAQPNRTIDAEGNLAYDHVVDRLYLVYVDRPTTSSSDTNIFFRYSFTTRTPGRYRKVLGPLADRFTMASHLLDWN